MWVVCLRVCLYTMWMQSPQWPDEASDPLGARVMSSVSSHVDAETQVSLRESSLGFLKEQQVRRAAEPVSSP